MVEQHAITGVIAEISGTTPGVPSQILYTIDANIPGSGPVRLYGQRPLDSYEDDECDVIARPKGKGVHGMIVGAWPGGEVQWDFAERVAFARCPNVTPPPGGSGTPPPPPPPPTALTGEGGSFSNSGVGAGA